MALLGIYNGLVGLRQRVREAWSGIGVQLKRRTSLIPNLVETVKGYAAHERGTLNSVTNARTRLMQAGSAHEAAEADNMLSGALNGLCDTHPPIDERVARLRAMTGQISQG